MMKFRVHPCFHVIHLVNCYRFGYKAQTEVNTIMKLKFLGATGTVTGSKYLLQHNDQNILIDYGLFQGLKELRLRNWETLPVKPSSISAVILTHAHIDHSGYIFLLVKTGFKGKIYCSAATYLRAPEVKI